ncbi:MAG TPA: tyrosine-protein phosphatase [Isosphaeraceae bacterium]|jgi:protein tyrosine phosphatase (PTP) superfamily phosphohydrolase (DUF442 family)|nr:tyrosine-protein phosphatase [Isosphaeraceae bacterium]
MTGPRTRRLLARLAATLALAALAFLGVRWGTGNRGDVVPGRVLRSAQLDSKMLAKVLRAEKIRTVLNLRGGNPHQPWYNAERTATLAAGASQVDFPMATDLWLSREQARTLLRVLDSAEYPLLIHCQWGAERTGLVAAFAVLLRPGGTLAEARRQFSLYYLFLPTRHGRMMSGHLDAYEAWLRSSHLDHAPEHFRRWLGSAYAPPPGGPSREIWRCNPYPLVEVHRPGTARVDRVASAKPCPCDLVPRSRR